MFEWNQDSSASIAPTPYNQVVTSGLGLVLNIPGDFEASSTGHASLGGSDVAPIDLLRFLWPKLFTRPVDGLLNFTFNNEVVLDKFLSYSSFYKRHRVRLNTFMFRTISTFHCLCVIGMHGAATSSDELAILAVAHPKH